MNNFVLIFICLSVGFLLKRSRRFPVFTAQVLNAFVIQISLPALVLTQIPPLLQTQTWGITMLIPISMAWLLFATSFIVFKKLGNKFGWDQATLGALVLTAGLGNTSFVGLPLLESLLGTEALPIGVIVDQLGSFLVLSTLGILAASRFSGTSKDKVSALSMIRNILFFPPFIALIAAGVWSASGTFGPGLALSIFEKLAVTLVPLALVAVGYQVSVSPVALARNWKSLFWGLSFKLFFAPLIFFILYTQVFSSFTLATHVTILEAAMAPMITAAVVATDFGLNKEVASLMLGIGIPLSLLTVPLWHEVLLKIFPLL